jgi:L-lactate dehydrogenase complex protein LldG
VVSATVDTFVERMTNNRCGVHGPLARDEAASTAVALAVRHPGGEIALPVGDPLVDALGISALLVDAKATVLRSDDPTWNERLPNAGVGITGSIVAVAERGTIALSSGAGTPRATSLLPPVHLCLVRVDAIVDTFAEAITRLAAGALPSALIWVGGPSRTGDLEMKTTFGVHGPKTVEIVLVGD